jgi:hypothetical protein
VLGVAACSGKQAFVREEEDKGQEGLMLQEMHPFGSVSFFLSFFLLLSSMFFAAAGVCSK